MRKREKESFPLIPSTNVAAFPYTKKDKKGNVDLLYKYAPIGIEDDFFQDKNNVKFSKDNTMKQLSSQSARNKIDQIRRYQGSLINAT